MTHFNKFIILLLGVFAFANNQYAFSLVGPQPPWQTQVLGYQAPAPGSLAAGGGPMNIDEEYRWNVPSVHYGFTADFLTFFGLRGTEEIEKAIAILNDLPPADDIVINDYPLESLRMNHRAAAVGLTDLKSTTLQLLTVSLGLADPIRYVYSLRNRYIVAQVTNYHVTMRNFDPITWEYSPFINGTLYTYSVVDPYIATPLVSLAANLPTDPLDQLLPRTMPVSADAWYAIPSGGFFTGLTRDDVGGIKYIYRSANYNTETALADISGAGGGVVGGGGGGGSGIGDFPGTVTSPGGGIYDFPFLVSTNAVTGGGATGGGQTTTNAFINPALRGGRQKISFLRSDYDSLLGTFFQPLTVRFSENVLTNGNTRSQTLIRTVTQPDYVFDAADLQGGDANQATPLLSVTGTANWLSSDAFDGTTGDDAGPGIITPSFTITYNNVGPLFINQQSAGLFFLNEGDITTAPIIAWGAYDGTTNAPLVFPNRITIEDLERLVGGR